MATMTLRRFTHPATLKSIEQQHLLRMLEPFEVYLARRGVTMPGLWQSEIDYDGLLEVLMAPDDDTPINLAEALYFIHELANRCGMDALIQKANLHGLKLQTDSSPADVAVQMWLLDRRAVEEVHARSAMSRPRAFTSFAGAVPTETFEMPSDDALRVLETELDDWFEGRQRGRGCRVFIFPEPDLVWFLIRHGDAVRRVATMDDEQGSVVFRPEKYDVLTYCPSTGEIRINARQENELFFYRYALGKHLFGDEDFFSFRQKYTLAPLGNEREAALVCSDVMGVARVTLRQLHVRPPSKYKKREVHDSQDVFGDWHDDPFMIRDGSQFEQAKFEVEFEHGKRTRVVTVQAPDKATFTRDDDGALIEQWLIRRGFCVYGTNQTRRDAGQLLEIA